jgi:hypothetical protein
MIEYSFFLNIFQKKVETQNNKYKPLGNLIT